MINEHEWESNCRGDGVKLFFTFVYPHDSVFGRDGTTKVTKLLI